ncbi:hypothetical protein SAMN02910358_01695 [Lachnospiraceae bacterium XBB1006]|nr:hypothetical protein SAMN02910358_01695 [Lachnospiraceae bacterium XBB1006]
MKQVIEGMVAMLFIMLLCITGMDLLNVHEQAGRAKEFRNHVATALVNSDYDESVMATCMAEAAKQNYMLQLELYKRDGSHISYGKGPMDQSTEMVEVTVTYKSELSTLHASWNQTVKITV